MIKYLSYAAPLLLKTSKNNPVKRLTGLLIAYILMALSFVFCLIALFIWVSKTYGTDVAFAALGAITFFTSLVIISMTRGRKSKIVKVENTYVNDPIAKHIPDTVKANPTVQKLLQQITETPITATATAVTIGVLLSKEIFEET